MMKVAAVIYGITLIVLCVFACRDLLRDFPKIGQRIKVYWQGWKDWWLEQ